ncbi:MAG: hypothetical protein A2644_02640 [Candidatus Zambryskibacteria bacterium RIFCSPHIGHO2_01_FULL_39_63]|nr:MAG: hypothetical protein A2644_02640 [Candidatus Zambryskibacteria bacterium RIFCSPHIGHO2_01_FULL_39_63]OHA94390.1 MAG: hypothetical protein A3B88_01675 [Candidatus Zambryskibacteria bacterium RIFCSPHIGHO2_02_FULL_39_19]OHA98798.1 MAG: hypothetical protein A3F20_00935 [Candidatus Zambryskibacteria bacterium RIFCSPHIGHO2_12_FULL_39_21]
MARVYTVPRIKLRRLKDSASTWCSRPDIIARSPKRERNPKIMTQSQKVLLAEANKILARAGYSSDGRPKSDRRMSLKAVSTPCGGRTDRRK